jgi:Tfp pilus assembly protein FimV
MIQFAAILLLIVLGICSGVMLHVSAMNDQPSAAKQVSTEPESSPALYCVSPGDTLWAIAVQYGPDEISVKQYIRMIMEHNDLTSANLQVGQVIRLP